MFALSANCHSLIRPLLPSRKSKQIDKYRPRGPYRSYTIQEKEQVYTLHTWGMTFASISKQLEIPQKNVVRWCKEFAASKNLVRNNSEEMMEKKLFSWMQEREEY